MNGIAREFIRYGNKWTSFHSILLIKFKLFNIFLLKIQLKSMNISDMGNEDSTEKNDTWIIFRNRNDSFFFASKLFVLAGNYLFYFWS